MNLFEKFATNFGSVDSALAFLSMNGYSVTKGRYNEWLTGKRLPRYEMLNLILSTVTDVSLTPVNTRSVRRNKVESDLVGAVSVDVLRKALPHRRFSNDFYKQARLFDGQVLNVIYGYDVWETFLNLCGNENNAVYVLRRNCPGRRVTTDWLQNRIDDGWYADVVNVMVRLICRFEGSDVPFTAMDLSSPAVVTVREQVRQINPACDIDAMPDDVVMQIYKDMQ